jgi:hypothetical protein
MYKSIILPLAKLDIQEAAQWYNERQTGLGKRFLTHVRETVHYIRKTPTPQLFVITPSELFY